jgi:hypothetical protein
MSGNEASAIGSMRAINSAQVTYAASCGGGGYAQSLVDLADPPDANGTPFISPDLGTGVTVTKSGYDIVLGPGVDNTAVLAAAATCNGTNSFSDYHASGEPTDFGDSGTRNFATNQTGTIWQKFTAGAIAAGMAGGTVLQ